MVPSNESQSDLECFHTLIMFQGTSDREMVLIKIVEHADADTDFVPRETDRVADFCARYATTSSFYWPTTINTLTEFSKRTFLNPNPFWITTWRYRTPPYSAPPPEFRNSRPRPHFVPLVIRRPQISNSSSASVCRLNSTSSSSSSSDDMANLRETITLLTKKACTPMHGGEVDDIRSKISSLVDELLTSSRLNNLEDDDDLIDFVAFLEYRSAVFLWRLKLTDAVLHLVPEEHAEPSPSLAGPTGPISSAISSPMPAVAGYEAPGFYGRLMLIDKVENVLKQIHDHARLSPNLSTYNILMAAYLTAWMWDRMESTYEGMLTGNVKPDAFTHCLMLRGYAHACISRRWRRCTN
ncbi:hypothetical protein KSP40_PGU012711 [Platanthera guangdongensis]|uniref:Uncharacterized protein n=1 Tax=Platanthera guangdongensis TaxID=2320717 RepID=A0ABR2LJR6_9ASPA